MIRSHASISAGVAIVEEEGNLSVIVADNAPASRKQLTVERAQRVIANALSGSYVFPTRAAATRFLNWRYDESTALRMAALLIDPAEDPAAQNHAVRALQASLQDPRVFGSIRAHLFAYEALHAAEIASALDALRRVPVTPQSAQLQHLFQSLDLHHLVTTFVAGTFADIAVRVSGSPALADTCVAWALHGNFFDSLDSTPTIAGADLHRFGFYEFLPQPAAEAIAQTLQLFRAAVTTDCPTTVAAYLVANSEYLADDAATERLGAFLAGGLTPADGVVAHLCRLVLAAPFVAPAPEDLIGIANAAVDGRSTLLREGLIALWSVRRKYCESGVAPWNVLGADDPLSWRAASASPDEHYLCVEEGITQEITGVRAEAAARVLQDVETFFAVDVPDVSYSPSRSGRALQSRRRATALV